MQITPEIKAQLAEQKKQCIFCKLIAGEMPAKTVFEDDKCIAMLDIYPAMKGHTLFMLKEHYPLPAYVSGEEFRHKFSLIPDLVAALKSAVVRTGANVFVAMGGVAGQQAPHFLVHLFPREVGDGWFKYLFDRNKEGLDEKGKSMLANNMPIMMNNHFGRNPAAWHVGKGDVPAHLVAVYERDFVIYEDEKVLCVAPETSVAKGHLVVYSKEEGKDVEKLSQESSSHFFFTGSFASTAVFEGLGAQGTNIILKSGVADDNPTGRLAMHVIPRWQNDGIDLLWQPSQPSYDLDSLASKIKDASWKVKYGGTSKAEEKKKVIPALEKKVERIGGGVDVGSSKGKHREEILAAMKKIRGA